MKTWWQRLKYGGREDSLQVPVPRERAASEEPKAHSRLSPRILSALKMRRSESENNLKSTSGGDLKREMMGNGAAGMAYEVAGMQWSNATSPLPPFPKEAMNILPDDSVPRVAWKVSKYGYELRTFSLHVANRDIDGLEVCSMHRSDVDALNIPDHEKTALWQLVERSKLHPEECAVSMGASSAALYRLLSVIRGLTVAPTLLHNHKIDGMEFCSPLSRQDFEAFGIPEAEINALLIVVLRSVPVVFRDCVPIKLQK